MRWGRTSCPTQLGTTLLYSGRAAGTWYNDGGGANLLCLPSNPEYLSANSAANSRAPLHGVEIQHTVGGITANHNIPCAVCYTPTRGTQVMIPAWTHCPASWTKEYVGYIMTEDKDHSRLEFVCVD